MDKNDFYLEFTVDSLNAAFKKDPAIELPFAATKESRKWLFKICRMHKAKYKEEIEFRFKSVKGNNMKMCFFKKLT